MPIWLHLILTALCSVVGFFGGAMFGVFAATLAIWGLHELGAEGVAVNLLVGVPLFFGGAFVGLSLGTAFAVYCLPARCPQCGGRTYYRSGRRDRRWRVAYECGACGHIYVTGVRGG
jgi:hypothetical protein